MTESILNQLAYSRKELLDLGLRNPLISFKTRKSKIDIIDEISENIYDILVNKVKIMKFLPLMVPTEESDDALLEMMKQESPDWSKWFMEGEGEKVPNTGRYTDSNLQTNLSPVELHSRLLSLHNGARTYLEEQGVNVLYLALGFIHWAEDSDSSSAMRKAPILLIPVELKRSDARTKFSINYNLAEIGSNLSLIEKFRSEFAISLPQIMDPESIDILEYFNKVEESVKSRPNWKVNRNEMVLSYFSFGKFVMYEDLDPKKWPEVQNPSINGIINGLLGDSMVTDKELVSEDQNIDLLLDPNLSTHVVDADSSQARAIIDIANGHNLVIQGPPGTGKSQTITNIIADAIYKGKKVLFVAEKMAALEVVKQRLDKVGLGDAVLELHSHKANKVALIEELRRTLSLGTSRNEDQLPNYKELKYIQDLLNNYAEAINKPILNSGLSPNEVIGKISSITSAGATTKRIDFVYLVNYTQEEFALKKLIVEESVERLQRIGIPSQNPFFGCEIELYLPSKQQTHSKMLQDTLEIVDNLIDIDRRIKEIKLSVGKNFGDFRALAKNLKYLESSPELDVVDRRNSCWLEGKSIDKTIKLLKEIIQHEKLLKQHIKSPKISENIDQIVAVLNRYGEKWWKIIVPEYRKTIKKLATIFSKDIPKDVKFTIAILKELKDYQGKIKKLSNIENVYHKIFGKLWSSWRTKLSEIEAITSWLKDSHARVKAGEYPEYIFALLDQHLSKEILKNLRTDIEIGLSKYEQTARDIGNEFRNPELVSFDAKFANESFDSFKLTIQKWLYEYTELIKIAEYNVLLNKLRENNLLFLKEVIEDWPGATKELVVCYELSWYQGLLDHALAERRALTEFNKNVHGSLREKFKQLDKQTLLLNQLKIAKKHREGMPKNSGEVGQMGVLKREMNKKRRLLPIRKLMSEAGDVIRSIKPVFMMGPLSVASFIPQELSNFDLVIFDEASQVKPVDAFGAILRGNQVVVIGDSKQLPPTTFFESMSTDNEIESEEYSVSSETESILGLFLSKNAPERMLNWHYRSRHDSLIAISNSQFYDNKLVVFPSPGRDHYANGLSFKYLPQTSYDRGKTRANIGEAVEVAHAIHDHITSRSGLTLGVAAFSTAQRDAIILQVEKIRREYPYTEYFFNGHNHEPFFVKNLENVQGDERDVILISIGYGKTDGGESLNMNFGPLNKEGGERRLNVLISRARMSCIVFANFKAEEMNTEKTAAKGVHALKTYLRFAETGKLEDQNYSYTQNLPPFENYISGKLKNAGYDVVPQIGFTGYRLDLGILDHGNSPRFIAAIECDGRNFYSAHSARDRERLRSEVLESLGWSLQRVWSIEWYRNEAEEWKTLISAIELAKENKKDPFHQKIASSDVRNLSDVVVSPSSREDVSVGSASNPSRPIQANNTNIFSDSPRINTTKYTKFNEKIPMNPESLHLINPVALAGYVRQIVMIEGPVHSEIVKKRIANCVGVAKVGSRINSNLNKAIKSALYKRLVSYEDMFLYIAENPVVVRDRSSEDQAMKNPEYIAPSEVRMNMIQIIKDAYSVSEDELIHHCFEKFGFQKVTSQMKAIGAKSINKLIEDKVIQKDSMERFVIS